MKFPVTSWSVMFCLGVSQIKWTWSPVKYGQGLDHPAFEPVQPHSRCCCSFWLDIVVQNSVCCIEHLGGG